MRERKQKEIEYYDRKAEEMLEKSLKDIRGDFESLYLESDFLLKNYLCCFLYFSFFGLFGFKKFLR